MRRRSKANLFAAKARSAEAIRKSCSIPANRRDAIHDMLCSALMNILDETRQDHIARRVSDHGFSVEGPIIAWCEGIVEREMLTPVFVRRPFNRRWTVRRIISVVVRVLGLRLLQKLPPRTPKAGFPEDLSMAHSVPARAAPIRRPGPAGGSLAGKESAKVRPMRLTHLSPFIILIVVRRGGRRHLRSPASAERSAGQFRPAFGPTAQSRR